MIELPIAGWLAALILLVIIFVAYRIGKGAGVHEGIVSTIGTLKALNLIDQSDIDKIVEAGDKYE